MTHDREEIVASSEIEPLLPLKQPTLQRQHSFLDAIPKAHSPGVVVGLMSMVVFVIMFGAFLILVPLNRILEDIICHHFYDNIKGEGHIGLSGEIDEKYCKGNEVQGELATILGVQDMVESIPGVFLAFPYGVLSDRIGRKPVLYLSLIGAICIQICQAVILWFWRTFPVRLLWLSPLCLIIGGGQTVIQNMLYAILSDVSTNESRSNNFFIVACATLSAGVIAPSIAAWLMQKTPWLPFFLGMCLFVCGFLLSIFVPETLHLHAKNGGVVVDEIAPPPPASVAPSTLGTNGRVTSFFKLQAHRFMEATSILHSLPIILLLVTFLLHPGLNTLILFSVRYISKRFDWTLAKTGFLLSMRAAVNIVVLLAVLPGLTYLLTKQPVLGAVEGRWYKTFYIGMTTRAKDLFLARISLFFLVTGTLLLGLAPSVLVAAVALIVFTFGTGFSALCRACITTLVDQEHVGRLYAAISVVETIGNFGISPSLAALYGWGLRNSEKGLGDLWIGAPYYGAAIFFMVVGSGSLLIKLPAERQRVVVDGREEVRAHETNEE